MSALNTSSGTTVLVRERSDTLTITVGRRVVMRFCLSVILSFRSFFKMLLLRQFLSELDDILTQRSSVWCVNGSRR